MYCIHVLVVRGPRNVHVGKTTLKVTITLKIRSDTSHDERLSVCS